MSSYLICLEIGLFISADETHQQKSLKMEKGGVHLHVRNVHLAI